jgi:GntR family transcriptional repressor for pyruvate dehydrogenase complex
VKLRRSRRSAAARRIWSRCAAHCAISGNPYFIDVLEYVGQFLRGATMVTRANEATRVDFARQVRAEHGTVVDAIAAKDPEGARIAAGRHMQNAAARIRQADPEFWREQDPLLDQVLRPRLRTRRTSPRPAPTQQP